MRFPITPWPTPAEQVEQAIESIMLSHDGQTQRIQIDTGSEWITLEGPRSGFTTEETTSPDGVVTVECKFVGFRVVERIPIVETS